MLAIIWDAFSGEIVRVWGGNVVDWGMRVTVTVTCWGTAVATVDAWVAEKGGTVVEIVWEDVAPAMVQGWWVAAVAPSSLFAGGLLGLEPDIPAAAAVG